MTPGWTEGKPWEISLRRAPVGRSGNDDWVDGRETVGNSLGGAALGRSDAGVTTGWREGTPCEIASGELRWGKERYGNDDRVDGREIV